MGMVPRSVAALSFSGKSIERELRNVSHMDMLLLERTQLCDTLCGFSTDCGMQEAEMTIP